MVVGRRKWGHAHSPYDREGGENGGPPTAAKAHRTLNWGEMGAPGIGERQSCWHGGSGNGVHTGTLAENGEHPEPQAW